MPLLIQCSSCGHQETIPDSAVGTEIRCVKCQMAFVPLTPDKMENFAAKVLFSAPSSKEEVIRPETEGPEIEFVCPFCQEVYQVSAELAGKEIKCRNCHQPSKVDSPGPKKRVRRRRSKTPWHLIWLCLFMTAVALLIGFLLGRLSRS